MLRVQSEKEIASIKLAGSTMLDQLTQDGMPAISELMQTFESLKEGMERGIAQFKSIVASEKEMFQKEVASQVQELVRQELRHYEEAQLASWSAKAANATPELTSVADDAIDRRMIGESPARSQDSAQDELPPELSCVLNTFENRIQSTECMVSQVVELQAAVAGRNEDNFRALLEEERLATSKSLEKEGQARQEEIESMASIIFTTKQELEQEVLALKQRLPQGVPSSGPLSEAPFTSDINQQFNQIREVMQQEVEARRDSVTRLNNGLESACRTIGELSAEVAQHSRRTASLQQLIMQGHENGTEQYG